MPQLEQLVLLLAGSSRLLSAYPALGSPQPHGFARQTDSATSDLEGWIKQEQVIASDKVFANIGNRAGADDGVIIASPSLVYSGNPWYLTTLAAAEQLCLALSTWETYGELNITDTSLGFFKSVAGENTTVGMLKKGDDSFEKVTSAVFDYADGFVDVIRQYTLANGTLAEQFNETDGVPTCARDLTWSYVAFLTAVHARSAYLSPPVSLPSTSSVALTNSRGACPDRGSYNGIMEVQFSVDVNTTSGEEEGVGVKKGRDAGKARKERH
ncbi:hypothetical protein JCM21900_005207 [Sporobolomyces salmonicolor]